MEKASKSEQMKRIRRELVHGRGLARQLRNNIKSGSSSSQESIRLFVEGLVNSCNISISMLTSTALPTHQHLPGMPPGSCRAKSMRDNSVCEDADCVLDAQSNNNKAGKRKCVKRVTQVTLAEGGGLETALEDGHSWRKYGQKGILGSKYPRGYYKCTHKTAQGCLARKQVQRTDEKGPPVFSVTYCGVHTCSHPLLSSPAPPPQSIPMPEIALPGLQHPHLANDFLQYSGSVLPSDTTQIEPVFPPTIPHFNHMNALFPNSMPFDVGYHLSPTTWPADNCEVGFYPGGGLECDLPGSSTAGLYQQTEFDPFYNVVDWDLSC